MSPFFERFQNAKRQAPPIIAHQRHASAPLLFVVGKKVNESHWPV